MERSDTIPVEDNSVKQPWGKLTSITIRQPNIDLKETEYTFGRANGNTIAIPDKRLSSTHCKVVREDDGKAYVVDLSTNGTFHENDKIGKGTKKELNSGDKVYLLHHSKVPQDDVLGYIFSYKDQDNSALKKLREEDVKALEEQKKLTEKQTKLADDLGEEMKCCICIDYIYQCVTLVPCLHNFCAACFSDWMKKSKVCPNCRADVSEVKKNSTINNIVEKFLNANPDKKRPQDEYDTMDKTNEIKTDRLSLKEFSKEQKKKKANRDYDDDDDDEEDEDDYDEDEDDEDEDDEDDDDGVGNGRQCPECIQARPSDGFKCNASNPAHLMCSSCYQPFPDRRNQFPQCCVLCNQSYCNLYRTCRNSGFGRRLDYLESHRVQPMLQSVTLRGNAYETKVINDYLNQQRQTCVDLFNDFMRDAVDKGNFKYKFNRALLQQIPLLQANTEIKMDRKTPVCSQCFDKVWFQIILQYRQSINSKLPSSIKDRPTCWYGINCRTMSHNPQHAQKLNHACEQTKF